MPPEPQGEAWFRSLLDAAPVMVWVSDETAGCTHFNKAWLAYTGRPLAMELGDGWVVGVHDDDRHRCLDVYRTAFERRERFRMEYRLRRADGSYGWVLDDGVPRYDDDGRFLGYIGSGVDVTEQKRAEDLMRSQTVTRALARRLLQDLVLRAAVPAATVRAVGRDVARDHAPDDGVGSFTTAFRDMGFGTVSLAAEAPGRFEFRASDLLEQRSGQALPTCHLTLGYLEGAVSVVTGKRALGTEMRCQSLGHPECRFVVMAQ